MVTFVSNFAKNYTQIGNRKTALWQTFVHYAFVSLLKCSYLMYYYSRCSRPRKSAYTHLVLILQQITAKPN